MIMRETELLRDADEGRDNMEGARCASLMKAGKDSKRHPSADTRARVHACTRARMLSNASLHPTSLRASMDTEHQDIGKRDLRIQEKSPAQMEKSPTLIAVVIASKAIEEAQELSALPLPRAPTRTRRGQGS